MQLEGAKTLDNLVSVSPYFDLATSDVRWHISKINNLAHELFHWGEEYSRWNRLGYYNPEMHVHYYNSEHKAEYSEEDNETFTRRWNHGQVHIGDTGKLIDASMIVMITYTTMNLKFQNS